MSGFRFCLDLTVRKADLNEFHVAYEKYFSFFQLACDGYFAMLDHKVGSDTSGIDLIAAETRCAYKKELQLGDSIKVECRVSKIKSKAVVMDFQINRDGEICATGSTTYLFFDYSIRKVVAAPSPLVQGIQVHEDLA
ncbi:acyl-CoA thioesterase [Desulfosarcina ovata]|uniref:4-hydroxybenzoyl-CoA thioesterase n=2 Tax=Desulfosarcina ovata TaxID=83564 RepID=A0A5K8ACX5_9BACT|nr:thioesterase family protein [Desulfosarcina ovata]BBO84038.1 hypothetical protein DSCO28_46040 [Desulfosarcina ovata subsp. sediminis]BBO90512.1 hypothetical protein DSCOOX_36920 [Desulfosarcina ovata subsp. ovata]